MILAVYDNLYDAVVCKWCGITRFPRQQPVDSTLTQLMAHMEESHPGIAQLAMLEDRVQIEWRGPTVRTYKNERTYTESWREVEVSS